MTLLCICNGNVHNAIQPEAFQADILIADGNPMEVSTKVEMVFIDGKLV